MVSQWQQFIEARLHQENMDGAMEKQIEREFMEPAMNYVNQLLERVPPVLHAEAVKWLASEISRLA